KKHLIEMKITDHENNTFDVYLVDDESGSMDTVIDISGREFRFNTEFASHWRDESGELTEEGLKELALDALSNMEEEEYHELVARGMESEEEPEPERRKGNEFEGKEVDEMATVGATYRERETGEPVKVVHIGLNDETGEAVVEVEKDGVTLPAYTGREFLAKYGLLSMPHRESKVDEVTMGVDYIKKAKGRMKDASAAMKDKDYDRASEILSDIADDCADGAKAAKKMKIVADDKAEKAAEKEKAAKVEEAESEKFGKYDYQGFKDAISHSISDEEAQELWKDFKSFDLRSDFESERWEIWMRDRLPKKWESKTNEGEGDLAGSTKEVFEVEFEKDGKKETTRVMHFSEAEAKELVAKRPGVKVLGVKKITSADESKSIEEGVVPASDTCPQCGEVMIMDSKIKEQRCQACGYGRKTKETKSKESKGDPLTRTLLDLLK
ncbi:MAG: hypothetical protein ACXAEN_24020, partial [Candidatus Thorarchaeota archaeon]